MFVHTVFFWLNNPDNDVDRAVLATGLNTLTAIPAITQAYVGTPSETRRDVIDHSFDFSLTLVFADLAAHDTYQIHPVHKQFVADCAHLWTRVQVYDAVGGAEKG